MLVLTRKVGEVIVIGANIRIQIMDIRGGKVRIGIVAPEDVVVDRQEVHDKRVSTQREWEILAPAIPELVVAV